MPEQISGCNPSGNPDNQPAPSPLGDPTIERRVMALEAGRDNGKNDKNPSDLATAVKTGERWLIGINGFALLVAIGIGIIYIFQLGEMRKSTDAATRTAKAASEQTKLLRQQIEGVEAAQVEYRSLFFQDGKIYFDAQNFGRVISKKVVVDFAIFRQKVSDTTQGVSSGHFHKEILQMEPVPDSNRADPWSDSDRQSHRMEVLSITSKEAAEINHLDPSYTIIIDGTITYDDGFGQTYTKPIPCSAYVYMPAFIPTNGSVIGATGEIKTMIQCSNYSFWIRNFLQDAARRHLKRQTDVQQ